MSAAQPATTGTVLICCVFGPLVAMIGCFVAIVPDGWKVPLVGLDVLLVVAMGVTLGQAVRQAKRERGE